MERVCRRRNKPLRACFWSKMESKRAHKKREDLMTSEKRSFPLALLDSAAPSLEEGGREGGGGSGGVAS